MQCNECEQDIPEPDMPGHIRYHRRNEADEIVNSKIKKKMKLKRPKIDPNAKTNRFLK